MSQGHHAMTNSENSKTRSVSTIQTFPPSGDEGKKYIYFYLSRHKAHYILSYDKTLYRILTMDKMVPYSGGGRLHFRVSISGHGKTVDYSVSDLAYACYNGWIRDEDHLLVDMKDFTDHKVRKGLEIDHADSDVRNNTQYNLSLMPENCNKRKGNITKRVKLPALLFTCYTGEEYRIYYERAKCHNESIDENDFTVFMSLSCSDPDTYVKILNDLVDGSITLDDDGSTIAERLRSKKHSWIKTDCIGAYDEDTMVSIFWQDTLASEPKSSFDHITAS